ncbi:MAG: hypothetical protein V3W34_14975 [Phycisphaerae bacterium]
MPRWMFTLPVVACLTLLDCLEGGTPWIRVPSALLLFATFLFQWCIASELFYERCDLYEKLDKATKK